MEENTNILHEKTEELFNHEKFEEIIALLTDELLEALNDAELYAWRARANHRLGCDVAVTMLFAEKAIAAAPNYFMGYFARACAWDSRKKYDKAIVDYTTAIDINPDFADAYYNRGLTWQCIKENDTVIDDYDKANADFDKAIVNYNKAIKIHPDDAKMYVWRGNTWYFKGDYKKAITDYTTAININSNFANAYYNRGLAWFAEKEYIEAIDDYTKGINLNPIYEDAYFVDRGNAWFARKEYKEAIADYTKAIGKKADFENAYYIRGLAKKEENIDLDGSKQDFEKYLELAIDENEIWTKYAKDYIKELDVMIKDPKLRHIRQLVNNIKDKLLLQEECVHYTSFSTLKNLILNESRFKIFEGNFMNDPSEGKEFYDFLNYKISTSCNDSPCAETFSPKPFIGSFVTKDRHNDLNMWRFYGKEERVEAKGCAITLNTQKFIDGINNILTKEKEEARRQVNESEIHFYRVVYHANKFSKFYIPGSEENEKALDDLMNELKNEVKQYVGDNRTFLEKYLNSIAFLFKSDAYKNENEVRLIVKGIEFKKEYDNDLNPPRVYIELEPIKKMVKQVTLGPKVDKVYEWASALHYSYKENPPEIVISHLPYK